MPLFQGGRISSSRATLSGGQYFEYSCYFFRETVFRVVVLLFQENSISSSRATLSGGSIWSSRATLSGGSIWSSRATLSGKQYLE